MKEFVKKLVKMRTTMVNRNVSKKNQMKVCKAIRKFKTYFEFYPNPKAESLKKYCQKHIDDLLLLMPGKGHPAHDKYFQELNQYIKL